MQLEGERLAYPQKSLSRVTAFLGQAERMDRPCVVAIAAALGMSDRTVRNDFARTFGVGPARFLKSRRMYAAREVLLAADADATVTRIAAAHGFTELGQFAAEYRAMFGESPSQTKRRRVSVDRA